ncbi:MAG: quinol:electron acceptor oxidoreductase subunit ActD [Thermodesulfobacteriota bacterium]
MAPLLGIYKHADTMMEAADRLQNTGYDVTIFSPVPLGHEPEYSAIKQRHNYVRYFTLFGGVAGFFFGIMLTLGTALLYILPRGGKPIFSMTPTLLISYETAILFGVLWTFLGFLIIAKLPYYGKGRLYDPIVNVDSFGLLVEGIRDDMYGEVEEVLREFGAEEVKPLERGIEEEA